MVLGKGSSIIMQCNVFKEYKNNTAKEVSLSFGFDGRTN
jgi:hypothetical protein